MFIIRLKNWTSITLWAQKQGFNYIYQYKDHLGNIRLSYTDVNQNTGAISLSIVEENNYYPFGLKHKGYNNVVNGTDHPYGFQGQEETDDPFGFNMLEFKYRMHDPAIGRFMQIDPLAEDYVYNSTYAFAENRVIDGIELEGLEWKSIKDEETGNTTLQLTVQLYNDANLTDKQLTSLKEDLTKQFEKSFGGEGITGELIINDTDKAKGDFLVTLQEKTSETITIDGKEYKTFKGGKAGEGGETQKNSFVVTAKVDGEIRTNTAITRSFSHEAGHTGGLYHPWSGLNTVQDIKQGAEGVTGSMIRGNLMNSDKNDIKANQSHTGRILTKGQLKSLDELVRKQQ